MRQPVNVVHITFCSWPKGTPRRKQTFENGKVEKEYWQVHSNLVNCGHEHPTEEEATEMCLSATRERYHEIRWPKKKEGK